MNVIIKNNNLPRFKISTVGNFSTSASDNPIKYQNNYKQIGIILIKKSKN